MMKVFYRYLPLQSEPDKWFISDLYTCSAGTGHPCIHTIRDYWDTGRSLSQHQFHQHWHLHTANDISIDPRLLVREPRVVYCGRGRPPEASQRVSQSQVISQVALVASTGRELSQFEIVNAQEDAALGRNTSQQTTENTQNEASHSTQSTRGRGVGSPRERGVDRSRGKPSNSRYSLRSGMQC